MQPSFCRKRHRGTRPFTVCRATALIISALLAGNTAARAQTIAADAIVTGARIWTGNAAQPYADALAIRDGRILAIGSVAEIEALAGARTERMRLDGAFMVPGFIDNHTHFERAGELLLGVNLLAVASDTAFVRAIRAARDRVPARAWLVGGEWGAYEDWQQGSAGRDSTAARRARWAPKRTLIDSTTPNTPVLVNRFDRSEHFANGAALEAAGATCSWEGVECVDGRMTGRLSAAAAARVRRAMPPKSLEQRLAEA